MLARILISILVGFHALAAIVGAITLTDWRKRRYVPMVSILVGCLSFYIIGASKFPIPEYILDHCAVIIVAAIDIGVPALLIWTLVLAWSGKRSVERALRITSAALLVLLIWFPPIGVRT